MTKMLRKVLIYLMSITFVVSMGMATLGCSKIPSYEMEEYVYNDPYELKVDEGISIDGILNESFWKENKTLTRGVDYLDIDVKMNSYIGDKGVYLSFEVNDNEVYYNETRGTHLNTGIELYVSSPAGENSLSGSAYEIDLNAGGKLNAKKRNGTGYTDTSDYARMGVKIDGELNSSTCKGYVIEAFLPFELFGGEVDFVYVMPAIIRSNSDLGSDRLWYNLLTENDGANNAYHSAKEWYKFDKNGIVSYEVTSVKTGDGNGKINLQYCALPSKPYEINIQPNDTSYVSSLKINGEEVIEQSNMSFDGVNYKIDKVLEDIDIEVEFVKIPAGNSTLDLSFTLNKLGEKVPADGAKVVITDKKNNKVFEQTLDADGKVEVGTLKNDRYFITCSYAGYVTSEEMFTLKTDCEYEKELQFALFSNENAHYDLSKVNDGIIKASKNANTDLVFTEQSQDFYIEFNLKASKEVTNDARFYLKFYDKKGGNYGVRTMEKFGTSSLNGIAFCGFGASDYISWKNYAFNTAQLNAMYGDGLKLAFARASGMFYVYVYDVTNEKFVTALSKQVGIDDTYALSKYMPYEITDFKYETSKSFGTFIKNPLNVWNYADAENGSVEFTGRTGILQFNKQVENFSLEFNYKRSGDTISGQDSAFYLRFDDANGHYGVRIMESANSPTNISFCTFSGANVGWKGYNFTSDQKTAIKNDGLKFKIQRLNGVITVYVENLTTNEMDLVLTSTETIGNGDVVSLTGWQPYALTSFIYNTQLN